MKKRKSISSKLETKFKVGRQEMMAYIENKKKQGWGKKKRK